jgi:integrase
MTVLLDAAGRRRSPATLPGYHAGRPPRNKGMRYPADPPTVEEIVAVMRHTSDDRHGSRLRAMIVVLWRAGLRIQEALALAEHDLDQRRGSLLVRNGKGGHRREVGMDEWGWEHLRPWLSARAQLLVGPLFCVIDGATRGRPWSGAAVRGEFRRLAAAADVRRRFAPHQLRHAHALELAREGVPLNIIQRQLGHANLGTTSIYLQGIDPEEIISAVRTRRAPSDDGQRRAPALTPPRRAGAYPGAPAPPWRSKRLDATTHMIEPRPTRASSQHRRRRMHLALSASDARRAIESRRTG